MRQVEPLETRRLLASFTAASVPELISDINAANAAGGSNTITLAAGASFNLNAVDNSANGPTGLPVIAPGDDLTILGNGDTIQRSTAGSTPAFRLFAIAAGGSLALDNLTLSGGVAAYDGGGVLNLGTLSLRGVTVQNCAVKGWSFASGGGIYSNGLLTIVDSTIRNNQALGDNGWLSGFNALPGGGAYGGGLYVAGGTAALTNTTVSSNLARGGNGADGLNLGKDAFPGSTTGAGRGGDAFGGGIYVYPNAAVTLRGTTVTGNAATGGTGGNAPRAGKAPAGAGRGGGIYIDSGASVGLDAFTRANARSNSASTSDNDIFGSFTVL